MRSRPAPRIRGLAALAPLVAAILALGCGRDVRPRIVIPPFPGDAAPALTLRSLEWSWNARSTAGYRGLFTQDFRFVCSALDPPPDPYASEPWTREDEMAFAEHLFTSGTATQPAATRLSLTLDRQFSVQPDPRPGHDNRWHKLVRSSFVLQVSGGVEWTVAGFGTFYLVRGDSALVPPEIVPLGYAADSTHWYINLWQDETSTAGGGRAMPATQASLCQLKDLYR